MRECRFSSNNFPHFIHGFSNQKIQAFFKLEFFNIQTRYYMTLQQFTKLDESINIYYPRYIYFINLCRYIDTS